MSYFSESRDYGRSCILTHFLVPCKFFFCQKIRRVRARFFSSSIYAEMGIPSIAGSCPDLLGMVLGSYQRLVSHVMS